MEFYLLLNKNVFCSWAKQEVKNIFVVNFQQREYSCHSSIQGVNYLLAWTCETPLYGKNVSFPTFQYILYWTWSNHVNHKRGSLISKQRSSFISFLWRRPIWMQNLPVPSQTKPLMKALCHVSPIVLNLHSQSDQLFHLLLAICFALH